MILGKSPVAKTFKFKIYTYKDKRYRDFSLSHAFDQTGTQHAKSVIYER